MYLPDTPGQRPDIQIGFIWVAIWDPRWFTIFLFHYGAPHPAFIRLYLRQRQRERERIFQPLNMQQQKNPSPPCPR